MNVHTLEPRIDQFNQLRQTAREAHNRLGQAMRVGQSVQSAMESFRQDRQAFRDVNNRLAEIKSETDKSLPGTTIGKVAHIAFLGCLFLGGAAVMGTAIGLKYGTNSIDDSLYNVLMGAGGALVTTKGPSLWFAVQDLKVFLVQKVKIDDPRKLASEDALAEAAYKVQISPEGEAQQAFEEYKSLWQGSSRRLRAAYPDPRKSDADTPTELKQMLERRDNDDTDEEDRSDVSIPVNDMYALPSTHRDDDRSGEP